jgi:hypothetical protein
MIITVETNQADTLENLTWLNADCCISSPSASFPKKMGGTNPYGSALSGQG